MIDIKVYVAHCKSLALRKSSIDEQFVGLFSDYEYYTDYDSQDLTDDLVRKYYDADGQSQQSKLALWSPEKHKSRTLNYAEISLTIKHYEIMNRLIQDRIDKAIVFEDDVLLCRDFESKFETYLSNTPPDYDVIFMGSGAGLRPNNVNDEQVAYLKSHPASKCTDSYIITKNACEKLTSTYLPFNLCVDFEIAFQMYKHDLKVYWWEPPLVTQGSEIGKFKSTLR